MNAATKLYGFDYRPSIRVRYGPGTLADLGAMVEELGGGRVLLVTDSHLMAAGHGGHAHDALTAAGHEVAVFQDVSENPSSEDVDACVAFARGAGGVDFIVALGGGSVMDCAKGFNFIYTNGGRMEDYWGKDKAIKPMLPSIGIPTTAGTGSEAQRYALISQGETHRKMACGDKKARFKAVILDPELPRTAPRQVVASTGMDAITHAVESFVTNCRNPMSQLYAREAWRLLETNFEAVLGRSDDMDAWGGMLLGAHFAGAAIENAMLGAAHACANPLTARFDVIHGVAVGLMLPHVIRFNRGETAALYAELAALAHLEGDDPVEALAARIEGLRAAAGLPGRLGEFGVDRANIEALAEDAKTQWTGSFNPRPVSVADFRDLYAAAL